MAKNRKYENVYQIKVSGSCTNGFSAKVTDKMIKAIVQGLEYSAGAQSNVTLDVVSTKGDYNAVTGETIE